MSAITVLGFHTRKSVSELFDNTDPAKGARVINLVNCVGYIPILGIFVGAMRLFISIRKWNESHSLSSFHAAMIARGTLEIVGGGLLLLIPDLLVSIGRHCSASQKEFQRA